MFFHVSFLLRHVLMCEPLLTLESNLFGLLVGALHRHDEDQVRPFKALFKAK